MGTDFGKNIVHWHTATLHTSTQASPSVGLLGFSIGHVWVSLTGAGGWVGVGFGWGLKVDSSDYFKDKCKMGGMRVETNTKSQSWGKVMNHVNKSTS